LLPSILFALYHILPVKILYVKKIVKSGKEKPEVTYSAANNWQEQKLNFLYLYFILLFYLELGRCRQRQDDIKRDLTEIGWEDVN
jgi:hypothetical protein